MWSTQPDGLPHRGQEQLRGSPGVTSKRELEQESGDRSLCSNGRPDHRAAHATSKARRYASARSQVPVHTSHAA